MSSQIRGWRPLAALGAIATGCWPIALWAQAVGPAADQEGPAAAGSVAGAATELPEDWAIHAQSTFVVQGHPAFASAYRGSNSLDPGNQARETFDLTLYGGVRLWEGAEAWVNPEVDQGFGLSATLGVAGFPSAEAYKVGDADPYARLQRVFLRQTINLGGGAEHIDAAANQLGGGRSADRLVLTIGKFAVTDIFDGNQYAHDPRSDFLNWSIVDIGSFDYAADAWGYSYGGAVEWAQDWWTVRSGLFDLSTAPNGKGLDTRAFDEFQYDQEFEERHTLLGRPGKFKLLAYLSHGRMGEYDQATLIAQETGAPADIAAVRQLHNKAGYGINLEQQVADDLGVFARSGLSEGQYEAYDFTDIDKTVSLGLSLIGSRWSRPDDTIGLAAALNDASHAAKQFFAAGGLGILVGDGQLVRAGPEGIIEAYYSLDAFGWAKLTLDYQFINNPAYNRDRGPVSVFAIRAHAQF